MTSNFLVCTSTRVSKYLKENRLKSEMNRLMIVLRLFKILVLLVFVIFNSIYEKMNEKLMQNVNMCITDKNGQDLKFSISDLNKVARIRVNP